MDEYNQGWDPNIKRYFMKIVNSFVYFFMWLFIFATAGLYFDLAITHGSLKWYNIVYYVVFIVSLVLLVRYLYRYWKEFL
ncbi:MAG TPA: hypothetical protein VGD26_07975 [Chitinophagaceae bacterium]